MDRDILRTSTQRIAGRMLSQQYDEAGVLSALESAYDFGRWLSVRRIDAGESNDSWCVETEAGDIVIRRSSPLKTRQSARFECALIDHLVGAGYPAPAVLRTRDGDAIVEIDDLEHMATRKLPGTMYERHDSTHLAVAARALSRYHHLVAGLPTTLSARESSALLDAHAVGPQKLAGALKVMVPMLGEVGRAQAETDAASLTSQMELVWRQLDHALNDLTYLIVHGSFNATSLLLVGDTLSGVVDFDRARHDVLGVDLAYAIEHFCRAKDQHNVKHVDLDLYQRFLEHYRPTSPATDADIESLPIMMRAQRLGKVAKRAGSILTKHAVEPRQPKDAAGFAKMLDREASRLRWLETNLTGSVPTPGPTGSITPPLDHPEENP
ncbi:MAG: phosphotransferase [Aeromicrobium sp.]